MLRWLRRQREGDDHRLVRPKSSEHLEPLEELIRVVNEAQERDARDEGRLYDPKLGEQLSSFRRKRLE